MLIYKDVGATMLQQEISRLESHCQRCSREASKLSGFVLEDMQGAGARALESRVRLQAAVARSHLAFCQSLLFADRRHLALVKKLPTTSAGVLNTAVAQERAQSARRERDALVRRRDEALAMARAQDATIAWAQVPLPERMDALALPYDRLIRVQDEVIRKNEKIIEQANRYVREAASVYRGVSTSNIDAAMQSSVSFANGRGWGNTGWIDAASFSAALNTSRMNREAAVPKSLMQQYWDGDLAWEGSLFSEERSGTVNVFSYDATGVISGELLGGSAFIAPYGKGRRDVEKDSTSAGFGVEAAAELHGAKGGVSGSYGITKADLQLSASEVGVTGTIGASFFTKDQFDPSLSVKGEARASLLKNETSARIGDGSYNYHLKVKSEALTARAEAGLSLGSRGVEAKAGAEAYAATGEVSGGFTLFGVKVDVSVEGKAGGAGSLAAVDVGPTSVEGELGIGLGLGLGTKLKVDWSDAWSSLVSV